MSKGGRPRVEIDQDQFEKLCGLHCTLPEIAAWFRCSEDTIERSCKRHYKMSFAEIHGQKKSIGAISLRRKMYEMAIGGDRVMLIWLSKNLLGWTDKVEQKQEIHQTTTTYRVNWADELDGSTSTTSKTDPSPEKN